MTASDSTTGIILAGGQGRRMDGADKGLELLDNRRLVDIVIERLQPQVSDIIISANRNLEIYRELGYPVIEDSPMFTGPLAGIYHGLAGSDTEFCFITPCDTPQLAPDIVQRLQQQLKKDNTLLSVPRDAERVQPLFMFMQRSLISELETFLRQGGLKVYDFLNSLPHSVVDCTDISDSFININTLAELEAAARQELKT